MLERTLERILVRAVKAMGGFSPKLVSPGTDGMPNRLVLFPGGKLAFVEMKAPGMQMRPLQVRRKGQLEALGFRVYCVDRLEQIGGVLDEICSPRLPDLRD